jgi:hypothetical protein
MPFICSNDNALINKRSLHVFFSQDHNNRLTAMIVMSPHGAKPRRQPMTSNFEIVTPYLPRAPAIRILQKAATGVAVAALRYRRLLGWRISKGSPSSLWEVVKAYHYPPRCHRTQCAEPGLRLNVSRSDSFYRITSWSCRLGGVPYVAGLSATRVLCLQYVYSVFKLHLRAKNHLSITMTFLGQKYGTSKKIF